MLRIHTPIRGVDRGGGGGGGQGAVALPMKILGWQTYRFAPPNKFDNLKNS